ncbi:MAG: hypothetical protein G01um101470_18 [Parcubacteria group bacterium Gr01-1014_70]|nr:MAG: hypothetical protein G01um101470_18 [Parcubacteria group bacterium Gr01-1014_70]
MQKGFGLMGILIVVGIIAVIGIGALQTGFVSKNPFVPTEEEKSAIDMAEEARDVVENESGSTNYELKEEKNNNIVSSAEGYVVIKKYPSEEAAQAFEDYYKERIKTDPTPDWLTVVNEFYVLHQNDPGFQYYEKLQVLQNAYNTQWQTLQYPKGVSVYSVFVYPYNEKPLFDYSPHLTTETKDNIKKTLSCGNRSDVFTIDFSQPYLCEVTQVNGKVVVYAIGILEQDKHERELGIPEKIILVNDILILENNHFITMRFNGIIPQHPLLGYAWPTETIGTVNFYLEFRPDENFWGVVKTQVSGYLSQPSEEVQDMMRILKKSVEVILNSM